MAVLGLGTVAAATGGAVIAGDPSYEVRRYSIDSRHLQGGELFFALIGPNHDGHRFLADVFASGGAAAVVSHDQPPMGPTVRVADTTVALRALAASVRAAWSGTAVGITGSCGKTTTKEMLRLALRGSFRVHATRGNLNNLFGLPLVLLDLEAAHQVAVLELGVSTPVEMEPLAALARPHVAVLLNVLPVHLANFDSLQALAATKVKILGGLEPGGTMVYNADDPFLAAAAARFSGRRLSFGLAAGASLTATKVNLKETDSVDATVHHDGERASLRLPAGGRHNLMNALAALAAARALDVALDVAAARLESFRPVPRRGQRLYLQNRVIVWDETYNSNPAAMESVLALLAVAPAHRKVVVAGDMLELGDGEVAAHQALATHVAAAGTALFIGVGPLSAHTVAGLSRHPEIEAVACDTTAGAVSALAERLQDGDLVLVKGSRGMALEEVVEALRRKRPETTP